MSQQARVDGTVRSPLDGTLAVSGLACESALRQPHRYVYIYSLKALICSAFRERAHLNRLDVWAPVIVSLVIGLATATDAQQYSQSIIIPILYCINALLAPFCFPRRVDFIGSCGVILTDHGIEVSSTQCAVFR